MRHSPLPTILRYGAVVFAGGLLWTLLEGGCGPGGTTPTALQLDTWLAGDGTAEPDPESPASDSADSNSPDGVIPLIPSQSYTTDSPGARPSGATVAGETQQRGEAGGDGGGGGAPDGGQDGQDAVPLLVVSPTALSFGAGGTDASFVVQNAGGGTMDYTVSAAASWATVSPSSGSNSGSSDPIAVHVVREGLASGSYTSLVQVAANDGQIADIAIYMTVPEAPLPPEEDPQLRLSDSLLDFGPEGGQRGFTIENTGGGKLEFSITSSAPWVMVAPVSGEVTTTAATIVVAIDRTYLFTGPFAAELTVTTNADGPVLVSITGEKPMVQPHVVPWIEMSGAEEPDIQYCFEGLRRWRRITDTAMVKCNVGRWEVYGDLHNRLAAEGADLRIIPGITVAVRLGTEGFDEIAEWQVLAQDVADLVAATGETTVIMECELAQYGYWHGLWEIDLDKLAQCVALLPTGIEYMWWPSVQPYEIEFQEESEAMCRLYQDLQTCQFIDCTWAPDRQTDPLNLLARQRLIDLAIQPPMPILYFRCFTSNGHCYWEYDQVHTVLELVGNIPAVIFYPPNSLWIDAAEALTVELGDN